tara:strand:+ start:6347 stop:7597 length:1251 start_codon:yes stop_codon:yes gene_type:complete
VRTVQELEQEEQSIIAKAQLAGFENPHDNENGNLLVTATAVQEYRRFIAGYKEYPQEKLTTDNNIKSETYSKERAEEMAAEFTSAKSKGKPNNGLLNPIVVVPSPVGKASVVEGGCNRYSGWFRPEFDNVPIPAFEVTGWYDTSTGSLAPADLQEGLRYLANVRGNPSAKVDQYSTNSVALHILELMEDTKGKFFGSFAEPVKLPASYNIGCVFDDIMNSVYGEVWPYRAPTTLGKILKTVGDPARLENKKKPFTDPEKTLALRKTGWHDGLVCGKRADCLEHRDEDGFNILIGNDQGHNFAGTQLIKMLIAHATGHTFIGFKMLASIHDVPSNLTALNKARKSLLATIEDYNKVLVMSGMPIISKVLMPQQLIGKAACDDQRVYDGPNFVKEFNKLNQSGKVVQPPSQEVGQCQQ